MVRKSRGVTIWTNKMGINMKTKINKKKAVSWGLLGLAIFGVILGIIYDKFNVIKKED